MIDLHCHILPGVDDGALDLRDSAGLARQAAADGIEAICATPHIRHDHDVRIDEVAERVEAVNRRLRGEGIAGRGAGRRRGGGDGGRGAERRGAGAGLAGRRALGPARAGARAARREPERRVEHLAERGHRALIAHPERHVSADMYERIGRLVELGALVQATADFFLRERMAAGMLALAEAGLVHVLSSDAHSSHGGRPAKLSAAFERLAR